MFSFSDNDLDQLHNASVGRQNELFDEFARLNARFVLDDMCEIMNQKYIKERMLQVCKEHVYPWDLKIGIYGYNGKKKMGRFTLDDVVNSRYVLYALDQMFNGDCPHGGHRFRVTTRKMPDGPTHAWREVMLHYYRGGVPAKLIRSDPNIPDDLPGSPVEMNPEDNDMPPLDDEVSIHENNCRCEDCCYSKGIAFQRDDESVHGGGCSCRKCRSGYNNM